MQEISKTKVGYIASLARKKVRERERVFVVEGTKSVADMSATGPHPYEPVSIVAMDEWHREHMEVSGRFATGLRYVATPEQLKKMSSLSAPPPVIAIFRLPDNADVPMPDSKHLYLVLDNIQDPGNLGTIIRTADWFGVHTIYASRDTVDVFNPKTIMATMGSLARVGVHYTDIYRMLIEHPDMPKYGMLLEGRDIYKEELEYRGFIIMGNEGKGISDILRSQIDRPLTIPPGDATCHPESLNVAIATAVTLSEFNRFK